MLQFYLCRHGQSEFNAKGRLQGHLESPLTPLGVTQAHTLAKQAESWNIQGVACSPLTRAHHTAQICAEHLTVPITRHQGLAERKLGDWQGEYVTNIPAFNAFQRQCYAQPALCPPASKQKSESTEQVRMRMQDALLTLGRTASDSPTACKLPSAPFEQVNVIAKKASNALHKNILIVSHGDALGCLMSLFTRPIALGNTQGFTLTCENETLLWGGLIE